MQLLSNHTLMKCHRSYPVNFSETTICQVFTWKLQRCFAIADYVPAVEVCPVVQAQSAELFTPLPRAGFPSYPMQFSTDFWTGLWQCSVSPFLLQWVVWWLPCSRPAPFL